MSASTRSLFLRSQDANSLSTMGHEAVWILPQSLTFPPGSKVGARIAQGQFWNVVKTVSSDNNLLATSWGSYTLTPGSYTGYTLATHLQSVLGSNIVVTLDSASYHYTFAVASQAM